MCREPKPWIADCNRTNDALNFNATQHTKSRPSGGFFYFEVSGIGAKDGARTRDLRRDRATL